MTEILQENNKTLVLKALETLFVQRDFANAEQYWSPDYLQHSANVGPGRDGLFNLVKALPPTATYEHGVIAAEGDFVILHTRYSGIGQPANWIAADIFRLHDGMIVEHWDVIQDEATQDQSQSGLPMFGSTFPKKEETK